jgi:hypothetical protein
MVAIFVVLLILGLVAVDAALQSRHQRQKQRALPAESPPARGR